MIKLNKFAKNILEILDVEIIQNYTAYINAHYTLLNHSTASIEIQFIHKNVCFIVFEGSGDILTLEKFGFFDQDDDALETSLSFSDCIFFCPTSRILTLWNVSDYCVTFIPNNYENDSVRRFISESKENISQYLNGLTSDDEFDRKETIFIRKIAERYRINLKY